jgi:hypothetical protein
MVDVAKIQGRPIASIKDVSFDEEMLKSFRCGCLGSIDGGRSDRVGRGKLSPIVPNPGVEYVRRLAWTHCLLMLEEHSAVRVWQPKEAPGQFDGNCVGRVQTEKPDPGTATLVMHVGSHVDFVKARQAPHRGASDGSHTGHREWHEPDIRTTVE